MATNFALLASLMPKTLATKNISVAPTQKLVAANLSTNKTTLAQGNGYTTDLPGGSTDTTGVDASSASFSDVCVSAGGILAGINCCYFAETKDYATYSDKGELVFAKSCAGGTGTSDGTKKALMLGGVALLALMLLR